MSPVAHEKGPALLTRATEPKSIFSLQKRRLVLTIIRAFVQVYVPSFLIGAGSSAITLTVIWAVTLWWRS